MQNRKNARDSALWVLRKLREAGHVAWFAGGCVRDLLIGRTPKDYDVVTDAPPERVVQLFPRARAVGQQFGVILVRRRGVDVEVATFRRDADYRDGRRPESVTFANDVEDARRRDFTINGMFLDPETGRVIDYVGGQADIEARIIRTIGDPADRFAEDHLRMLRAVRFATVLNYELAAETCEAIRRHAFQLHRISAERIWLELQVILACPERARGWRLLCDTGLVDHLVPGVRWPDDARQRIATRLEALGGTEVPVPVALAALAMEKTRDEAAALCLGLRLSNDLTDAVMWLLREVQVLLDARPHDLAQKKTWRAHALCDALLTLAGADAAARCDAPAVAAIDTLRKEVASLDPAKVAPPPLLTGDDLISFGYTPSPAFGRVLADIRRAQLNERIHTPDEAMAMARTVLESPPPPTSD